DDDGDFYVERAGPYLSSSSSPTALFHSLIYAAKDVTFDGAWVRDARTRAGRSCRHTTPTRPCAVKGQPEPQSTGANVSSIASVSTDTGANQRLTARQMAFEAPPGDTPIRKGVQRVCNIELTVDHTFYE
ncbi:hypothetical protein MTO96_050371, partial [Rhipicephalus appendiculatus]